MKIELFTLCDFASNEGGKLTIVNTLDTIFAEKLPWRAYIGFAIKGNIIHEQPDDIQITLSIFPKDNETTKLFEASTQIANKIGRFAAAGNLRGLIFDKEGDFIFRISTNNTLNEEYPFSVVSTERQESDK